MIRVPELKTGERPFDPDFEHIMTPWKGTAPAHTLAINDSSWGAIGTGAETAPPKEMTPDERIAMILNLAVVKEAVTALHRDEDDAMRLLEEIRSSEICDITANHEKFLKERMAAGENACKNEEQKALFRKMTATFLARSRDRAQATQQRKTLEYWTKTVEEQNAEFLARALREENVANDTAVTMYRDLILYNMENLLAHFPAAERNAKLHAAKSAFYEKVLEKRLEHDPAGTRALTEKAEIRRILGDAVCDEIAAKAAKAEREEAVAATARKWAEEKLPPDEAAHHAESTFTDEVERRQAMDNYLRARFEDNKATLDARVTNTSETWERLKEAEYDENAIPLWTVRNDPAFASCLRDCLRGRGDAGGGEGRADYESFLRFLEQFEQEGLWKTMERLREEEKFHALLVAAGGPEGELWTLAARLLQSKAEERDKEFTAALRAEWGQGRSREDMERFRLERKKDGE